MRVTAKQIAQELGLSQATVSLALRGKPGISDKVRKDILEAAARLGYEAPHPAVAMANRSIQLVIYKRHGKIVSDTPFFEQLTQGVADEANALGYRLSISYLYGGQDMAEQLQSLNSLPCSGIILLATEMRGPDIEQFQRIQVPLIVLDNFFPTVEYDSVAIDNVSGAFKAVQHLIRMGHTRLGYLHSKVDIRNFRERQNGYLMGCRSLPEQDAKDAARRIVSVGAATESAARDMQAYLAKRPTLPTAFFADNDRIALGCCQALQACGYRIPEDISVIGFDDSSLCTLLNPPLTTMNVQKQRMGALAVRRLHGVLETNSPETLHITVVPNVIARGTVLQLRDPKRKIFT